MSSKKLNEVFRVSEGAVDRTKPPIGKASLQHLGIGDLNDAKDVKEALDHLSSRLSFAFSALKRKIGFIDDDMKKVADPFDQKKGIEGVDTAAVGEAINTVMDALSSLRKVTVSSTKTQVPQREPEDPATGFADDPNPKTRNTKYPYRGYRSG